MLKIDAIPDNRINNSTNTAFNEYNVQTMVHIYLYAVKHTYTMVLLLDTQFQQNIAQNPTYTHAIVRTED